MNNFNLRNIAFILLFIFYGVMFYYFGSIFKFIIKGNCIYTIQSISKSIIMYLIYLIPFFFYKRMKLYIEMDIINYYKILGLLCATALILQISISFFHIHNH